MRVILSILCLLGISFVTAGQTANNTERKDSSNIYYQAFKTYCSQSSGEAKSKLLLEENSITTACIPKQIGNCEVEIINTARLHQLLQRKKSIILVRIVPLRFSDGKFFINIIPFNVKISGSNLSYINSGGSTVDFSYDCDNKRFVVHSVKTSGI